MNRILRGWWLAWALLLLPLVALAGKADGLAQLQQRVVQAAVVRGAFTQEKQVQGFRRPLLSSGQFLIARDKGVWWQTRKPFPSTLVFTRDRILNRGEDGRSQVEADARQQPALRQVNAVMFALMSGDLQAITRYFDARPELLEGQRWRLQLTPKPGALTQVFTQVTLEGERHVQQVEIIERNGDRTRLVFSGLSDTPSILTADEAHRFD